MFIWWHGKKLKISPQFNSIVIFDIEMRDDDGNLGLTFAYFFKLPLSLFEDLTMIIVHSIAILVLRWNVLMENREIGAKYQLLQTNPVPCLEL